MYQESSLINTKLNIPILSSKVIKRTNLFKKLNSFLDYRLILVTAPAGYGKTTLITSWLSEKKKNKSTVAWLSLGEEDNEAECFWSYFFLSVYKKISEINHCIEDSKSFYNESATFNNLYLSHFINTIAKINEGIIIVIDDFHLITNDKIIENMKFLIKNMPDNMHLLLISRNLPQLGLPRLRAADSVLEINQYDLCFTPEETTEFFEKVSGTKFTYDIYHKVWSESEGWIAGIQMIGLSMKNSSRNITGDQDGKNNKFVFEYIAEEVFLSLEEDTKKFLLYTSIIDEFSCALCDYLLDINNSSELIKEIEKANLFLVSIDNEQSCFRYHNLFRNFLRKQLEKLGIETIHKLFNKVARWYENSNQLNKAVESYIKGKNFHKAVSIIEQLSGEIACRGEARVLHKWNQLLPIDIVKSNTRLIMNSAWAMVAEGDIGKVSEYIKMVQACEAVSFLKRSKGDEERDSQVRVEILALNSSANLTIINEVEEIITDCEKAIPYLNEEEFLTQLIFFNIARAYFLKGELGKAIHYFQKSLERSIKTKETYFRILTNKALTIYKKLQGNYKEAKQELEELISSLKVNGDVISPVLGILYAELADIHYQWNEIDKAMELAREGLALGLAGEDSWVIAENNLILAKLYNATNFHKEYQEIVDKTKKYLTDNKFFDTSLKFDSFNAEIMLSKGKVNPVLAWLSDIAPVISDDLIAIYPEVFIVKVKLYIYENQFDKARELISTIDKNVEKYQLNKVLVETKILSAKVYKKLGYIAKAISEIEKAMELSWQQKITRIFLDEGSWMEDMLKKLKNRLSGDDVSLYLDYLLVSFNSTSEIIIAVEDELLSKREIEILQSLEQGATNSEIAEKSFVSINTVKTHLLNIYTKLDVHSRTRAVVKAKELKLI
ncbi:LuxR C-terminal-related transcriptional regulator [Clostridium cellulovorans]|uniref:ATP-dependent transcriptional regulator, MalT-like, LuxR family n=1 Tax=Clostridium cellulovorans (strain ATCC 35296 / DSM 3052 / OCM 3 / 743B) TaxID=573061 RepID=D9SQG0_CLOC7|nr:LuxR C-terminal-related transcriptional regulator [Clostridium cellulovorans]ADL50227.1 ATP-dependent transcriptional regulator, MalT-like, LuxR family [Clostridium cellulovorans 743B]